MSSNKVVCIKSARLARSMRIKPCTPAQFDAACARHGAEVVSSIFGVFVQHGGQVIAAKLGEHHFIDSVA